MAGSLDFDSRALPRAIDAFRALATEYGVCTRLVLLRRTDLTTGLTEVIDLPCGATREDKCPACATRAKRLRQVQIREGWHRTDEPLPPPDPATPEQRALIELRAHYEHARAHAELTSQWDHVADLDAAIAEVEEAIAAEELRGRIAPPRHGEDQPDTDPGIRRVRSTKRRQDVPDLPRRREKRQNLAAAPRTLGDWLDEWMRLKERDGTRPTTVRGYRKLIENHVRPVLGKVALDKLSPTMIRRLLAEKTDEGLSPATVRHVHGLIRNALGDAEREELVHRNAARAVRPPAARQTERRSLTVAEAKRLLDVLRGEPTEALYVCALTVGLRRGELLGLSWDDIDLDAGTLTVRQTVLRVDGRIIVAAPKTDRSRRTVPVLEQTLTMLRGHRRRQAAQRLSMGERWQDHGLVFPSRLGTPMEPDNLDRSWHKIRAAADLNWLRLHDLRHACATFLLASGASPRTVMKVLGHSQIGLTMNTYAHVLPEIERAAVDQAARHQFG